MKHVYNDSILLIEKDNVAAAVVFQHWLINLPEIV